jgi:hypothetical protein
MGTVSLRRQTARLWECAVMSAARSASGVDPPPSFSRIDDELAVSPVGLLSLPFAELAAPTRAFFDLATRMAEEGRLLAPSPSARLCAAAAHQVGRKRNGASRH